MAPILQATATGTGASILLLDRQGVALTGPHRGRRLKAWVEIDAALRGASMTLLRDDGEPGWRYPVRWISPVAHSRLYHARPIQNGGAVTGVLLLTRPPMTLLDGIMEDGGKIMAGVATIFVLLLLLSAVLSRAIVRPIEGLSRATRHLASGRHAHPRPPALHVVEIQALYQDFGRMAAAIEARSRYLRDFAAAVSHEFKTPLAAITGAIELLQDHGDMRPDERARFLENMRADAERLSRLVRKLMELARADVLVGNRHARTDPTPLLSAIADALGTASFRVDVAQGGAAPAMAIDRDVLEAVLTTIVENARQAGAARMSIRLGHDGDAVMIDLADDGPGVPDGDRDRIFHPFFTSKRAMGGTGLGLAIARSLLEAYDGSLLLIPAAKGTHFRLICAAAGKNSGHSVFLQKGR
jgi:signal transduction histidine kinase